MADVLPNYVPIVSALEPLLANLPARIVGIDGRNGLGKTTLGRYLAWRFNVTLLASDLFAIDGSVLRGYRLDELNRQIQRRLSAPRPVLIEGVALLRLLEQLRRNPDFLIYCDTADPDTDDLLAPWLKEYERGFTPKSRASIVVRLDVDGS